MQEFTYVDRKNQKRINIEQSFFDLDDIIKVEQRYAVQVSDTTMMPQGATAGVKNN